MTNTVVVQVIYDNKDDDFTYFIGPVNVATENVDYAEQRIISAAKGIWHDFLAAYHLLGDNLVMVDMLTPFSFTGKEGKAATMSAHPELRVVAEQELSVDELPEFTDILSELQTIDPEVEW